MFTGIIETLGEVISIEDEGTNRHFIVRSDISSELKVDQSVSHNGVCLTVVEIKENTHTVTAVAETLEKSSLGGLQTGSLLNLERCMQMNGRLDGHIVQGHVDQTGTCTKVLDRNGSWEYTFSYRPDEGNVTVEKGSVCVNGISLTVVNSEAASFSVAIIPYTYQFTNMHQIKEGAVVNLEFDIIGKYVARLLQKG